MFSPFALPYTHLYHYDYHSILLQFPQNGPYLRTAYSVKLALASDSLNPDIRAKFLAAGDIIIGYGRSAYVYIS